VAGKIAALHLLVGRHGKVVFEESRGQGPGQTAKPAGHDLPAFHDQAGRHGDRDDAGAGGQADLDAPVSKYLPEYANLRVWQADGTSVPATRPMLVRNLMSHTSGLIYGFIQPTTPISQAWAAGGENRNDLTARDYAKLIAKLPLKNEPGTAWNYSRSTDVLGAVVEVAGGSRWMSGQRSASPARSDDRHRLRAASEQARFAQALGAADPQPRDIYVATTIGPRQAHLVVRRRPLLPRDYPLRAHAGRRRVQGRADPKKETLTRMRQDGTAGDPRAGLFFRTGAWASASLQLVTTTQAAAGRHVRLVGIGGTG
jgi:hypothetical protein